MITINGKVPSKSNSYQIITLRPKGRKPHSSLAKTQHVKNYELSFRIQLPQEMKKMRIESVFAIFVTVYFEFKRSDLDNAMKIILDSLQNCGVIKNDNQCFGIITEKKISKRPKIEFELMPMFEFEKVINFTKELISSQEGK